MDVYAAVTAAGQHGVGAPHAPRPLIARDAAPSPSPSTSSATPFDPSITTIAIIAAAAATAAAAAAVSSGRGRRCVIHRADRHQLTKVRLVHVFPVDAPGQHGGGGAPLGVL